MSLLDVDTTDLDLNHYRTKQMLLRQLEEVNSDDLVVFQDSSEEQGKNDVMYLCLIHFYFPITVDSNYIGSGKLRSNKLLSKKARLFILDV